MSGPELTVNRGVVDEIVRLAALEIPGVARVSRGGPAWRTLLAGPPVVTHCSSDGVRVRVWIVARPGQATRRSRRPRSAVPSARPSSGCSASGSSRSP